VVAHREGSARKVGMNEASGNLAATGGLLLPPSSQYGATSSSIPPSDCERHALARGWLAIVGQGDCGVVRTLRQNGRRPPLKGRRHCEQSEAHPLTGRVVRLAPTIRQKKAAPLTLGRRPLTQKDDQL
jgi:hypothetical protein